MRTNTSSDQSRDEYALNSAEVDVLLDLVGEHYDRPAIWASNLLCVQYKKCRAPYTGGKPKPKSIILQQQVLHHGAPAAALQIHPNPANNWTAFTFQLPGNRATLQLRIRDAQGRIAHSMQASGEEGQVVWDTRNVAPGVYTVELLRDGQVERTERLVIQQ